MHTAYYLILVISVLTFASLLTLGAYMLFGKMALLAEPEERSNHAKPVITGVGVGFMTAILGFLMVVNAPTPIILGGIVLLIVSVMDDRASLPASKRLGFQAIAVILAIHIFDGSVFGGLFPVWLDISLSAFLWLWMINLTNFMDGIDELTVMQGVGICGGIVVLTLFFSVMPQPVEIDALVIALGLISFYPWNRHPARCFMGDAGSIPLGFLFGYLLLSLCSHGLWQVALILPAYYLTDATLTLFKRALRREKLWQAHSTHFYQQAVRAGRSHRWVAHHVGILNLALIGLAALALYLPLQGWMAVAAAYGLSLLVCVHFASQRRRLSASAAIQIPSGQGDEISA